METDSENNEEYHEEKKRKLPIFGERKVRKKIFSYQEYHEEKIRKWPIFGEKVRKNSFLGNLKNTWAGYCHRHHKTPHDSPAPWFHKKWSSTGESTFYILRKILSLIWNQSLGSTSVGVDEIICFKKYFPRVTVKYLVFMCVVVVFSINLVFTIYEYFSRRRSAGWVLFIAGSIKLRITRREKEQKFTLIFSASISFLFWRKVRNLNL